MPDVEFTNLLVVAVIALLAPLTLGLAPALRFPSVVLEIIAGVVVGPQVLGWVEVDLPVSIVALLGLAFLLFLAGLEIDVHQLRGQSAQAGHAGLPRHAGTRGRGRARPRRRSAGSAARAWSPSPCRRRPWAWSFRCSRTPARSTPRLGQTTVAAASVADFAAIVLLSLLFSTSDTSTGSRLVLLRPVRGPGRHRRRLWSPSWPGPGSST